MPYKTKVIRQSEAYPRYYLVERPEGLHVALKTHEDADWDGFFSVGRIMDGENFETACATADEEFRGML
ncbi:hypothetical protein LCGC14_0728020 [marine sediment metagenome]|uniref:Uncharacterized protein n=1 Tax=marine sediment metagenome TaxID=412755 RepID=A0A0F9QAI1_9ZZZZ